MTAEFIKFKASSDDDNGESRLGVFSMLIERLALTSRFLNQQLAKLSGQ
jgi:hypothetical protein